MALQYQSFGLHKRDNRALEYEDACAAAPGLTCFAIADGATDSSYAALWAQLLVEDFVRSPACHPQEWQTWLPPLQQRWSAVVGQQPLPWYAETKLQQGAFAAFLGLVVDAGSEKGRNQWRAVAVGDCCLFQVRQQRVRRSFPISRSGDFNNHPGLVGSRTPPAVLLDREQVQTRKGGWRAGDQIWLMTDALAKWFLQQHEAGKAPCAAVEKVLAAASSETFVAWIDELRRTSGLRNDDVTLLAVSLTKEAAVNAGG